MSVTFKWLNIHPAFLTLLTCRGTNDYDEEKEVPLLYGPLQEEN